MTVMDRPDDEWSAERWRRFAQIEGQNPEPMMSACKQRELKERVARGEFRDDVERHTEEPDHGG